MLQVDSFRRTRRWKRGADILITWHSEVRRATHSAQMVRLSKVLACWRLWLQEQTLLRKYLQECSMANFRGDLVRSPRLASCSVEQADFERLYTKMASYRWGVADVISD